MQRILILFIGAFFALFLMGCTEAATASEVESPPKVSEETPPQPSDPIPAGKELLRFLRFLRDIQNFIIRKGIP